jgi:hypothetical protein
MAHVWVSRIELTFALALLTGTLCGCNDHNNSVQSAATNAATTTSATSDTTSSSSALTPTSTPTSSSASTSSSAPASSSASTSSSASNSSISSASQTVRAALSWTAPTQNTDGSTLTNLAGFRIYYGTDATALDSMVQITGASTTSYVVGSLSSGTYFFAIKSYNITGTESDLSGVVSLTI